MTMKTLLSTASLALLFGSTAASAQAPISLGHLADYSGPTSDVGTPFGQGVADTYAWINKNGGVGGALYAHYNQVVSNEGFGIDRSIIFLAMIIIGGLGSIMGTLMGTAFMVLLPESMEWLSVALRGSPIDQLLGLKNNIAFLREMAIGVIIIVFLVFEPDGLAHRWRQIKAYWKLYPFSH